MTQFLHHVRRFIQSEDGPTAVEYAVILALVIVVCLTAISTFQPRTQTVAAPSRHVEAQP
ncbi:MAG: Flp family type IVb pilin [Pirellulales bacterium]